MGKYRNKINPKKISEKTKRIITRCQDQRFFSPSFRERFTPSHARAIIPWRSVLYYDEKRRKGRQTRNTTSSAAAHTEIREIPPGGTLVLGTRGRDTSWPPAGIKGCEYRPGLPDVVHPLGRTIGPRLVASSRFVGKGAVLEGGRERNLVARLTNRPHCGIICRITAGIRRFSRRED